jgi:hypothetical protein
LNQLWFNEVTDNRGNHLAGGSPASEAGLPSSAPGRRASPRPRDGGGGKGLITKAVKLLVHFPGVAARISGAQLSQLEMNDDAGARFLFELIDQLQQEPAAHTAQLLERWRDRPEAARMQALAAEELLGHDEASATLELVAAIEKLALEPTIRRLDELMSKNELSEDERTELKELNVTIHLAKSRGLPNAPGGP